MHQVVLLFIKDMACVWRKFSLDTSRFEYVSKSGHVSIIQRIHWKLPLDTSHTHLLIYLSEIFDDSTLNVFFYSTSFLGEFGLWLALNRRLALFPPHSTSMALCHFRFHPFGTRKLQTVFHSRVS